MSGSNRLEQVSHLFHMAEKTDVGKKVIHETGAVIMATTLATLPIAAPLAVVAVPALIFYGLSKWLKW